jgi:hypothetical protein
MSRIVLAVSALLVSARAATGTPFVVPIDTGQSSLTVELCIAGGCDSDVSPVAGHSTIKLTPLMTPAAMTLYDFHYALTESIDLHISYGFLGQFTATGTGVELIYPTPGSPQPPTSVIDGDFVYENVPTDSAGLVQYNATGIACVALGSLDPPLPCNGTMDLSEQGTYSGTITGTVDITPERLVTLILDVDVSQPIDAGNPDLGTITTSGTVVGTVTLPLRGDANLDGLLDGRDVQAAVNVLLNPEAATWQERFAVDMNDDDAFDAADAAALADCLRGVVCPD